MVLIAVALFMLGAISDHERGKVSNIILALLWVWVFFFGNAGYAVIGFGLAMLINEVVFKLYKTPLFGWADVLGFPVYASAFSIIGFTPLAILGAGLPIVLSSIKRKGVPCFPYYAAALLLGLCLSTICEYAIKP